MQGKLIVIDGIDGSGKATQTKLLVGRLKREGYRVATLDYPQYSRFFGTIIGKYQRGDFGPPVNPYLISVLYAADRWETKEKIFSWLRAGYIVVLDRYTSANQIHQGARLPAHERRAFQTWLQKLEQGIFGLPKPDLVVYLHLPAKISAILTLKKSQRGYLGRERVDQMERDLAHQEASARQAMRIGEKTRNWIVINCIKNGKLLPKSEVAGLVARAVLPKL